VTLLKQKKYKQQVVNEMQGLPSSIKRKIFRIVRVFRE